MRKRKKKKGGGGRNKVDAKDLCEKNYTVVKCVNVYKKKYWCVKVLVSNGIKEIGWSWAEML